MRGRHSFGHGFDLQVLFFPWPRIWLANRFNPCKIYIKIEFKTFKKKSFTYILIALHERDQCVFVSNVKPVGFVFTTNSKLCKKTLTVLRKTRLWDLGFYNVVWQDRLCQSDPWNRQDWSALTKYNRLAAVRHQLSADINHKLLFSPNQRIFFVGESAIGLHIRLWGSYEILNYGQNVSQPVSFARSSWGRLMVNEAIFKQP